MASGGEEAVGIDLNAEGKAESLVGQTASKQRGQTARLLASNDRLRRVWDTNSSSSAEQQQQLSRYVCCTSRAPYAAAEQ